MARSDVRGRGGQPLDMNPYESLPVPISFASGETNEAFRALTGGHRAWQEALHPEDRERVEAAVTQARSSGEAVRLEARLRDPDGAWRGMSANGVSLEDSY